MCISRFLQRLKKLIGLRVVVMAVEKKIYYLRTNLGLGSTASCNAARGRRRGKMAIFHHADVSRARAALPSGVDGRLSVGLSALVIGVLSAFSWAALISIVIALEAAL